MSPATKEILIRYICYIGGYSNKKCSKMCSWHVTVYHQSQAVFEKMLKCVVLSLFRLFSPISEVQCEWHFLEAVPQPCSCAIVMILEQRNVCKHIINATVLTQIYTSLIRLSAYRHTWWAFSPTTPLDSSLLEPFCTLWETPALFHSSFSRSLAPPYLLECSLPRK